MVVTWRCGGPSLGPRHPDGDGSGDECPTYGPAPHRVPGLTAGGAGASVDTGQLPQIPLPFLHQLLDHVGVHGPMLRRSRARDKWQERHLSV